MFDLTGKFALVTGATGGIGNAIAEALHAQGATVALSGTREAVLQELAGKLGSRAHVVPCNLADAEAVNGLIGKAEAAMGQVDILVNNAGRSEEHTSELQSLMRISYAVFCLKKKHQTKN